MGLTQISIRDFDKLTKRDLNRTIGLRTWRLRKGSSLDGAPQLLALMEVTRSGAQSNFQFMRKGYFILNPDSTADRPVFNRTVTLKDSFAKEVKKG